MKNKWDFGPYILNDYPLKVHNGGNRVNWDLFYHVVFMAFQGAYGWRMEPSLSMKERKKGKERQRRTYIRETHIWWVPRNEYRSKERVVMGCLREAQSAIWCQGLQNYPDYEPEMIFESLDNLSLQTGLGSKVLGGCSDWLSCTRRMRNFGDLG